MLDAPAAPPRRLVAGAVLALALGAHLALLAGPAPAAAASGSRRGAKGPEEASEKAPDPAERWSGLTLRPIGPALAGGRVADLAVDPSHPATWYVAVASGGVFKTVNAGTTWTPIFDEEGSFSIGCILLDPADPLVVWVGTGENNSQRSVAYGDGVYKSLDGGKSWKRMGLEASEHIGRIALDPRDSDTVWVAAQGPLWAPGGDRGLYKSTDGGASWKAVLSISADTGVSDVVLDPRDPDTVYAAAWQRRRHVFTAIQGGPESALYKSTDGGTTWRKLTTGLPKVDLGRIGLAISPQDPDVLYALVDAARGEGGAYRSADRGESWEKRADYKPSGAQYYQELTADPHQFDRLYSQDTFLKVSDDGGKSWRDLGESSKHVDNHAIWVDPSERDHLLVGSDGGLYESFDRGASWAFHANLPTLQFYKVAVDDREPFYNVYAGTQDNFTLGGPAATRWQHGILNSDWFVVTTGDGFQAAVEPGNSDVVYAQAQHGELVRFDRATGEETYIKPQPAPGEPPLRFNWDSPLAISPHAPTRLYFASQRVFRSDDRGNSWRAVSPDLTRQLDRNQLEVMGRRWEADAVAKSLSTSWYGNIVALAESPRVEGLLYAGTDDGLVQVSEDGGATWRRQDGLPGVPERAYVRRLAPSRHAADTVYAACENHKMGDFRPYVLKSTDRGRTWTSIAGDLPARGSVYGVLEDPKDPELLFAGTEFGLYFTPDGGRRWIRLKGGLPTIQVRDLAIQERQDDLVVATFGRGLFILDDLSPLRGAQGVDLEREAVLFAVREAKGFHPASPLGYRDKAFQGDAFFAAPNPPLGAVFTYSLPEGVKSAREGRWEAEEEAREKRLPVPYPAPEVLRAEAAEEKPQILLTVRDESGDVVRRIEGPLESGIHRVAWDLRYPPAEPVSLEGPAEVNAYTPVPRGPMAAPGEFTVTLERRARGETTVVAGPQRFVARPAYSSPLAAADREALEAFVREVAALQRAALGASAVAEETARRLAHIRKAVLNTTAEDAAHREQARGLEARLREVQRALDGDAELARRNEPVAAGIVERVTAITWSHWTSNAAPTQTNRDAFASASRLLAEELARLRPLVEEELPALERALEAAGAPWTPGRVPVWPRPAGPSS